MTFVGRGLTRPVADTLPARNAGPTVHQGEIANGLRHEEGNGDRA